MSKILNELFSGMTITPKSVFEFCISVIVGLCVIVLFTSILINFIESNRKQKVKREKKSIVETGTMTLFFMFFYFLIRQKVWLFSIELLPLHIILSSMGTIMIVSGCVINVKGRFNLGKNWANQIKIYKDHTLVNLGVYRIVRHPLYASIIWMFYGACLVYHNAAALIANTLIFIPFMYYRAKQEEDLLTKQFNEYENYKSRTGMFFPRILRRAKNEGM